MATLLAFAGLSACAGYAAPLLDSTSLQFAGPIALRPALEPTSTPTAPGAPAALDQTPLVARQLTEAGCCTRAFWSPDSRWVAFIDRPDVDRPAAIYAVPIEGGAAQLVSPDVGWLSADWTTLLTDQGGRAVVERVADGRRWTVPNEARAVVLSPSGSSVAWAMGSRGITNPDLRERIIWMAASDGSGAREILRVRGGGILGWGEAEQHLIVSGRLQAEGAAGIWRVEPENGRAVLLAEVERPRDPLLSPDGGWLAYFTAFGAGPGENGLFLLRTDGSRLIHLDVFGAYRWRGQGRLLVIPLDASEHAALRMIQIDAESGETTDMPVSSEILADIGGNEWQVSPDGANFMYWSRSNRSLWAVPLPEI